MKSPSPKSSPLHVFDAEAMNTSFKIRIHHPDKKEAQQVTGNCFRQLEELEAELSRYRPESEVSRINQLKPGESMLLAEATYRCLARALEATEATAGLFDATLGVQTREGAEAPPAGTLRLSPGRPEITCEEAGRQLDFGGIGKGFALDEMAHTLRELGVDSALLSCGASTHLALGPRAWPFTLRGDEQSLSIHLTGQALSSSGTGLQGAHVVHPDTGASPDYAFVRVWTIAESAASADAYSTACLIMDEGEIVSFASAQRENRVEVYAEGAGEGGVFRVEPLE